MGVAYSARATLALVRLFQRFNSINIFVEDERYSNVYMNLLARMLPPGATVRRVFSLGGRTSVLAASLDPAFVTKAPRLFVIDGDFDRLLGVAAPENPDVLRLNSYCLENVLCCERALIEIALESSADLTPAAAKQALQFKAWRKEISRKLFPLFVRYALSEELKTGCTTTGTSVHAFLEGPNNSKRLSDAKIAAKMDQLEREILKHITVTEMRSRERAIRKRIGKAPAELCAVISGKNYLLPLLFLRLRETTRYRDAPEALPVRLSKHADIDGTAPELKARIVALAV